MPGQGQLLFIHFLAAWREARHRAVGSRQLPTDWAYAKLGSAMPPSLAEQSAALTIYGQATTDRV